MNASRAARAAASFLLLAATSCTSLREIPRGDYAARPERRDVRVHTRDGLVYEFDYVHVQRDSLFGFRRRDVEGPGDEFARVPIALEDVDVFASRSIDWYRTGLIGGGVLAAVIVGGLSAAGRNTNDNSNSGGTKIPPDRPAR
jgi:hypothetical protein